jgi:hypothetical protein
MITERQEVLQQKKKSIPSESGLANGDFVVYDNENDLMPLHFAQKCYP